MGLKLPEMLWRPGFSSTNLQVRVGLDLNVRFVYAKFLLDTSSDVHFIFFFLQFLFIVVDRFGAMLNIVPSALRQQLNDVVSNIPRNNLPNILPQYRKMPGDDEDGGLCSWG